MAQNWVLAGAPQGILPVSAKGSALTDSRIGSGRWDPHSEQPVGLREARGCRAPPPLLCRGCLFLIAFGIADWTKIFL